MITIAFLMKHIYRNLSKKVKEGCKVTHFTAEGIGGPYLLEIGSFGSNVACIKVVYYMSVMWT